MESDRACPCVDVQDVALRLARWSSCGQPEFSDETGVGSSKALRLLVQDPLFLSEPVETAVRLWTRFLYDSCIHRLSLLWRVVKFCICRSRRCQSASNGAVSRSFPCGLLPFSSSEDIVRVASDACKVIAWTFTVLGIKPVFLVFTCALSGLCLFCSPGDAR